MVSQTEYASSQYIGSPSRKSLVRTARRPRSAKWSSSRVVGKNVEFISENDPFLSIICRMLEQLSDLDKRVGTKVFCSMLSSLIKFVLLSTEYDPGKLCRPADPISAPSEPGRGGGWAVAVVPSRPLLVDRKSIALVVSTRPYHALAGRTKVTRRWFK